MGKIWVPATARMAGAGLLVAALTAGLASASQAATTSPAIARGPVIARTGLTAPTRLNTGCGGRHFATQWWDNAGSARTAKVIAVKFATIVGIDATLRR